MTSSHNWNILNELASKYDKTQNQIILNWMCNLGYYPMVMSANKKHIDENIESVNFVMSDVDYKKITDFRSPDYSSAIIDWEGTKIDDNVVSIVNLVTDFEKDSQ